MKSVTTLLGKYFNQDFSKIPKHILETARVRGLELHTSVEEYYKGNDDYVIPLEYSTWYDNFIEFTKEHETKSIHQEIRLTDDELGLTGRFDAVMEIDGRVMLVDFKFTSSCNVPYVELQTTFYRYMLERQMGISVDGQCVLHINKNGWDLIELNYELDNALNLLAFDKYIEERG